MDESETTNSELVEKKLELGETASELNPCQGYKIDLVSKLHLCNACEYHKGRNERRPWIKRVGIDKSANV